MSLSFGGVTVRAVPRGASSTLPASGVTLCCGQRGVLSGEGGRTTGLGKGRGEVYDDGDGSTGGVGSGLGDCRLWGEVEWDSERGVFGSGRTRFSLALAALSVGLQSEEQLEDADDGSE